MELYAKSDNYTIYHGSMLDMLSVIEPQTVDCIITDPPYGLTSITKRYGKEDSAPNQYGKDGSFARLTKGFMGKEWDGSGIEYNLDAWKNCYEVLKPGGYLLAFGGTRTYHRIACAIEDAGFEIRDCIMWLYGSGFPKSTNIGLAIDKRNAANNDLDEISEDCEDYKAQNEWSGWGSALKPAYEPIIVARKIFNGSLIDNVLTHNIGALNIDECRIEGNIEGRYPSNVIHDGSKEATADMPNTKQGGNITKTYEKNQLVYGKYPDTQPFNSYQDEGSAARYFYCAKATAKDRDEGLEELETQMFHRTRPDADPNKLTGLNTEDRWKPIPRKNIHPTVKPTELMQYLIRLVAPKGATILDPFMGSGSTGKAAMYENREHDKNYKFIGIELTKEYLPIAEARINYYCDYRSYVEPAKPNSAGQQQMTLFDFGLTK